MQPSRSYLMDRNTVRRPHRRAALVGILICTWHWKIGSVVKTGILQGGQIAPELRQELLAIGVLLPALAAHLKVRMYRDDGAFQTAARRAALRPFDPHIAR